MLGAIFRAELISIVDRLMHPAGVTDLEQQRLIKRLQQLVRDPTVTDYIYWPDRERTAEEIVDLATAYEGR